LAGSDTQIGPSCALGRGDVGVEVEGSVSAELGCGVGKELGSGAIGDPSPELGVSLVNTNGESRHVGSDEVTVSVEKSEERWKAPPRSRSAAVRASSPFCWVVQDFMATVVSSLRISTPLRPKYSD